MFILLDICERTGRSRPINLANAKYPHKNQQTKCLSKLIP
ncbi:MAG: hypothetical protein ACI9PC_001336, partial [Porticoccaceae bacterium]